MMRNNKALSKIKTSSPIKEVMSDLKVGTEILYMTQYTVDKCKVDFVSTKEDVAVLTNQVRVSKKITSLGFLSKIGGTPSGTTIRIWSEEAEKEFEFQLAKRSIPTLTGNIQLLSNGLSREAMVNLHKKLTRIIEKFR